MAEKRDPDPDPRMCILDKLAEFSFEPSLSQHFRDCHDRCCSKIIGFLFSANGSSTFPPTLCLCDPCSTYYLDANVWKNGIIEKMGSILESRIGNGTEVGTIFHVQIVLSNLRSKINFCRDGFGDRRRHC